MMTAEKDPVVRAMADQMKAAFDEGRRHALRNGGRSKNPYYNVDADLSLCWDTGWVDGGEESDRREAQRRKGKAA
jgi:hypothetical protein